jgi:hypothetical protein
VQVAEKEYATVEEDIAKYKCREVHWKDFVWPLWQLSRLHEMAHLDPEAEPLPLSPLSFRETVCGRDTHEFLHHVRQHTHTHTHEASAECNTVR